MNREDATQIVLASVAAASVGAVIVTMVRSGFSTEDVTALCGALIGTAGAVFGAAWVSDRNANREKRTEQSVIRTELGALRDVAQVAYEAFPLHGPWNDAWRSSLNALIDVSRGNGRFLDEVIAYAKTLDFHQRETVKVARARVQDFVDLHDDAFGSPNGLHPMDERSWPGVIYDLLGSVNDALHTFK